MTDINLILNMNDHSFVVCAFNTTVSKVDDFLASEAKGTKVVGAGQVVDDVIKKLVPLLDTDLKAKGILFVGSGVSGGEEGARYGPSLMPGGNEEAWPHIKTICQGIAAKVGTGEPCCDWVGDEAAGHFVKMVHNGIEYGDVLLICEAYHLMKDVLGMAQDTMAQAFEDWNKTELDSFLIEITANILKFQDADGKRLLPKIRDSAGQKGMGKWTTISALEYSVPVTLTGEAVFARCLSPLKNERIQASKKLKGPQKFQSLYTSKIISYAQAFMLLRQHHLLWLDPQLWWHRPDVERGLQHQKCIRRKDKGTSEPPTDSFKSAVENCQGLWWRALSTGVQAGIPMPCFTTALFFYDRYRHKMLPANLIQAQQDYFKAHTWQFIHTNWTGHGGSVSSSSYNA
uniref:phosphogluconate dehydrogenase (NADP(+)-dependent, decarboxylating) n=1 Tax=Cercocebus atys TaxID=9531 RepID=A0A2K5LXL8_CERAT